MPIPSRAEADAMAAQLPEDATDRWGEPLGDRGRRLFALRDAGYRGALDTDSYPVTEEESAAIIDEMDGR